MDNDARKDFGKVHWGPLSIPLAELCQVLRVPGACRRDYTIHTSQMDVSASRGAQNIVVVSIINWRRLVDPVHEDALCPFESGSVYLFY